MARHYLDHASTSPPRPEVVAAMTERLSRPAGDPGRIHAEGLESRVAVETAREQQAVPQRLRYREIAAAIDVEIASGAVAVGSRLPSEAALAARHAADPDLVVDWERARYLAHT